MDTRLLLPLVFALAACDAAPDAPTLLVSADEVSARSKDELGPWLAEQHVLDANGDDVTFEAYLRAQIEPLDDMDLDFDQRRAALAEIVEDALELQLADGGQLGDVVPFEDALRGPERPEVVASGTLASAVPGPLPACPAGSWDCLPGDGEPIPPPPPLADVSYNYEIDASSWDVFFFIWHGTLETRTWKMTTWGAENLPIPITLGMKDGAFVDDFACIPANVTGGWFKQASNVTSLSMSKTSALQKFGMSWRVWYSDSDTLSLSRQGCNGVWGKGSSHAEGSVPAD